MGKIENFDIVFDQEDDPRSPVYFAGEEIRGKLILTLKEETKINEILLEFKGGARTYWTKHSGKSRKHFRQTEPYFCEQFNTRYTHAYGKHHERLLPIGKHEIPFTFKLAKTLPSSFEGEFGFVRYTCKAVIERPWDHDLICKRAFSVVGLEDLNNVDTKAAEPIDVSETDFGVTKCFKRQGAVVVRVTLPKTGYAPGERVAVSVDVANDSRVALKRARLRLTQRTRYMAKDFHNKEHVKEVCRVLATREPPRDRFGSIKSRASESWSCPDLYMEPIAPKLIRCTIVDINYFVEFEMEPSISIAVPILVGTIPLAPAGRHTPTAALAPLAPLQLENVDVLDVKDKHVKNADQKDKVKLRVRLSSSIIGQLYPSLPPPTFEKWPFGEVDISEERENIAFGDTKFTPKYACYRNLSSTL